MLATVIAAGIGFLATREADGAADDDDGREGLTGRCERDEETAAGLCVQG